MEAGKGSQQRIPLKYEIVAGVCIVIIGFSALWLLFFLLSYFAIDLKKVTFFLAYRTLLVITLPTIMCPVALLGEYLNKEWKRRKFLWRSAIAGMGIFGIFASVTILLLTLFDMFFPEVDVIWQIPLAMGCSSLGLIAIALLFWNHRFKGFAKEHLGW